MTEQTGSKVWWNQKYETSNDYLYGRAPSTFLADNLRYLRKGHTLDIGSGEGRNAVYLASKDYEVLGIDFSDIAMKRAETLAKQTDVRVEFKNQDLNFFLVPLMKHDSIILIDTRPPLTLLKSLSRGLVNGGTLFVEAYTVNQIGRSGPKPDISECYKPNELLRHVTDLHVIYYNERIHDNEPARVQLIAKKSIR
ncbi:MAG: class I SAM-dependent methyltransferase [Bdellovibrionales bacterium]|nr:class I SAM-dependent methyltransferase [Bdellovibrionales bacterium]